MLADAGAGAAASFGECGPLGLRRGPNLPAAEGLGFRRQREGEVTFGHNIRSFHGLWPRRCASCTGRSVSPMSRSVQLGSQGLRVFSCFEYLTRNTILRLAESSSKHLKDSSRVTALAAESVIGIQ